MKKKLVLAMFAMALSLSMTACGDKEEKDEDSKAVVEQSDEKDESKSEESKEESKEESTVEESSEEESSEEESTEEESTEEESTEEESSEEVVVTDLTGATEAIGGDVVGSWELNYDMSELLTAELGEDVQAGSLVLNMTFDFKADGTVEAFMDDASYENLLEGFKDFMSDYFVVMLMDSMGVSDKAELDEMLKSSYGMGVDDFLAATLTEFDMSEALNRDDLQKSGYYKVEGNKLFIGDDADDLGDPQLFTVEGDQLTIFLEDGDFLEGFEGNLVMIRK